MLLWLQFRSASEAEKESTKSKHLEVEGERPVSTERESGGRGGEHCCARTANKQHADLLIVE